MKKKTVFSQLGAFLAGLAGGVIAFMLMLFLEGALVFFKLAVFLTSGGGTLLFPAFIEEFVKVAIVKTLGRRHGLWEVALGVGVGVGVVEGVIAQRGIDTRLLINKFLYLQPLFLLAGGAIAWLIFPKRDKFFFIFWVVFSAVLHWAYNVLSFSLD
jgi:hypothetical protein